MGVTIVPVAQHHKPEWRRLFEGYAAFYKVPMNDTIAETTWRWLHDPKHEVEGLIAEGARGPVGLAHYRRMPSPLRGIDIGFLDDLFVDPAARGERGGEALIARLAEIARERGWPRIRWITADDNYRARTLYDRVAKKTTWNLYEINL